MNKKECLELIEGLKSQIASLESKVHNMKDDRAESGWGCNEGERLYFISTEGDISNVICYKKYDWVCELQHNLVFSDKHLCEEINQEQLVYRTIRKWRDEHDKDYKLIDWKNDDCKYYIGYNPIDTRSCLDVSFICHNKALNTTYFSNSELVKQCIKDNRSLLESYFKTN